MRHHTFRQHLFLVFEPLGIELTEYMADPMHGGSLPPKIAAHISTQLLQALDFLKGLKMVHCDVKPENILLASNPQRSSIHPITCSMSYGWGSSEPPRIKLIDFNSSTTEGGALFLYIQVLTASVHTSPIQICCSEQTRFYRCPEIILGARYGCPIDMWSCGCVIAEMLTGANAASTKV